MHAHTHTQHTYTTQHNTHITQRTCVHTHTHTVMNLVTKGMNRYHNQTGRAVSQSVNEPRSNLNNILTLPEPLTNLIIWCATHYIVLDGRKLWRTRRACRGATSGWWTGVAWPCRQTGSSRCSASAKVAAPPSCSP